MTNIYEAFYDNALSKDPLSIGHNTTWIKRIEPPNPIKLDWWPRTNLLFTILDVHILNCFCKDSNLFKYFNDLTHNNKTPTFAYLRMWVQQIFYCYGQARAYDLTMQGCYTLQKSAVPNGNLWTPPSTESSLASAQVEPENKIKGTKQKRKQETLLQEQLNATAKGDSRHLWKGTKKYFKYSVNMTCGIKLKLSPAF
ncbi:hypothetical protein BDV98DRAFT_586324 [Pterulicium gracile]|uniref:DUF6589 domain-containing protein n=1 Tax=Pterulicium gracile TaxID=1884261 RepID=A0A5C3Q830_9AGAR|nr:hypothetical protein BDV98DRAFT_586324 [Pterula gracilis]